MVFGTVAEGANADEQGTRSRCGRLDHWEKLSVHSGQCSSRAEVPRPRGLEGAAGPRQARDPTAGEGEAASGARQG